MLKLSRHAHTRIRYGDSQMVRTIAPPKRVLSLFSQANLVIKHCEYHIVYVPEDDACIGAVIDKDTIITVLPDCQISWQLPKLLAKRRYGLRVLQDNAPIPPAKKFTRTAATVVEVVASVGERQTVLFASTCFDFAEDWFRQRWFLEMLGEEIIHAKNISPAFTNVCVMYRGRGTKEYAPTWMIMELLGKTL